MDQGLAELSDWLKGEGGLAEVAKRKRPEPTAADVDAQVSLAGGD